MNEIVRREYPNNRHPRDHHSAILTRKNKGDLVRELRRLDRAGEILDATPIVYSRRAHLYGVKVRSREPLSPPPPAWHRTAKIIGSIVVGVLLACTGLVLAVGHVLRGLSEAAAGVPWGGFLVLGLVAVAFFLLGTSPGRACCRIIIEHRH